MTYLYWLALVPLASLLAWLAPHGTVFVGALLLAVWGVANLMSR